MTSKDIRIVFMGTPDFAVPSLAGLVENGYQVVGVVTMPDKAIGRHHESLQPSPVKIYAREHHIPVLQPEKFRTPEFLSALEALRADLQVVVAFRMLPREVWAMPRLGTFNLHAALLPQYRGAAPINWAIINGDRETGVTTFFLDEDIDTGNIIMQEKMEIKPTDCAEDIHDQMMAKGARLVMQTVDIIAAGQAKAIPQEQFALHGPLRPAPKIFKDMCRLRWEELKLDQAYNLVRGLSPHPTAWTEVRLPDGKDTTLKVFRTSMIKKVHALNPGTLLSDGKTFVHVALPGGMLSLDEVQLAGKKRMGTAEFLRGTHVGGWVLL